MRISARRAAERASIREAEHRSELFKGTIRLINTTTGVICDDADGGDHLFKWLAAEEGDLFDRWKTMQPHTAIWGEVQGTIVLDYSVAMRWACAIATLHSDTLELSIAKKGLLSSAAITRCLGIGLAAIVVSSPKTLLRPLTRGTFTTALTAAATALPATERSALLLQEADLLELPDATTAFTSVYRWISEMTIGMVREQSTGSARHLGWIMEAASGHGPAARNGDKGDLQALLRRIRGQLDDAIVGDINEDIAVAVAAQVKNFQAPPALMVYRERGADRRLAAVEELVSQPSREVVQANLFSARAIEVVGHWEVLDLATRGSECSSEISDHISKLLRAASITGPASAGVLDNLAYKMRDRKPWLAQESQTTLPAAERVAALSMKVEGDHSRVEFQSAGTGAPASGESKGSKKHLAAALDAAREAGFLDTVADAHACYKAGDNMGATRIMFCGRSDRRKTDPPNTLCKKIMYGKIEPFEINPEYGWMGELVGDVPRYLGKEVSARWVEDDLGEAVEFNALSLDALWGSLKLDGEKWGGAVDVIEQVLRPLMVATHGADITKEAADRYTDPLLNMHVPLLIGHVMDAIGESRSGKLSLRKEFERSLKFVLVHAGYNATGANAGALLIAQAALWRGLLSEAGERIDTVRYGPDYKRGPLEHTLKSTESSGPQAAFDGVKKAFVKAAAERKHGTGSSSRLSQPLAGCKAMAGILPGASAPTPRTPADTKTELEKEAAAAKKKADEKDRARQQQARDYRTGVTQQGDTLTYGRVEYSDANVCAQLGKLGCPDMCPRWAVWAIRSHRDNDDADTGCSDKACTKEHLNPIPTGFILSEARTDAGVKRPAPTSGKGKGKGGKGGAAGGKSPSRGRPRT